MKKKHLILTLILIVLLIISSFFVQEKNEILIDNFDANNEVLAFYVENEKGEYDSSDTIPLKNSGYMFKEASCNGNATLSFDSTKWSIKISNMNENSTRCKLYFDIDEAKAKNYILAQNTVNDGTPDFSTIATTDEGMFTAEDDDGISYYYRGAVTNNYFYFAGYYWRIIRINGDDTIRLIYQGLSADTSGADSIIATSVFNSVDTDNMYVGFMYTNGSTHGIEVDSAIKIILDDWYNNNLLDYSDYIDFDAGFCNDRTPFTNSSGTASGGGTGTTTTYYGARIRLNANKTPTYKCGESSDLFTISLSNKGNHALSKPIGLITADEISFAGGVISTANSSYYLYTNQVAWTMSPAAFTSAGSSNVFRLNANGAFAGSAATNSAGTRPVINIKKNVELTGTGTASNPYKIVGTLETPKITSEVTQTSITVTLTTSDEVAKYYYSIDNGAYTSSTANTYTFSGLSAGTSYTIKVYVEDAEGNVSSVNTKAVTTEKLSAKDIILANISNITTRSDFSTVVTASSKGTIYTAEDDDGTSYYFAGAVKDNYVIFAGLNWRVIRINGDGTIRLILSEPTGTGSRFNSSYNNYIYVGFKYTSGSVHGTGTNSTILTSLNNWYTSNLSNYAGYIDTNTGFCNDRYPSTSGSSSDGLVGPGESATYFGAHIRILANKSPSLKCISSEDLFTISSSSKGNKALSYPIGLITADEVAYAGGVYLIDNTSYYLYSESSYWTISPDNYSTYAQVFIVNSSGKIIYSDVNSADGVRPVINLKADTQFTGVGTSSNPYTVID